MSIIEIMLMALASCFDAMSVSVSYRISGIGFPLRCVMTMTFIHGLGMAFALFLADAVLPFSPQTCIKLGAVLILMFGITGILKPILSRIDRKQGGKLSKSSRAMALLIDETTADTDNSRSLSVKECIPLSLAVASDAMAVGICTGPSLSTGGKIFTSSATFVVCLILVLIGRNLGTQINRRLGGRFDLSCIQGGFLLLLGMYMLIFK